MSVSLSAIPVSCGYVLGRIDASVLNLMHFTDKSRNLKKRLKAVHPSLAGSTWLASRQSAAA